MPAQRAASGVITANAAAAIAKNRKISAAQRHAPAGTPPPLVMEVPASPSWTETTANAGEARVSSHASSR